MNLGRGQLKRKMEGEKGGYASPGREGSKEHRPGGRLTPLQLFHVFAEGSSRPSRNWMLGEHRNQPNASVFKGVHHQSMDTHVCACGSQPCSTLLCPMDCNLTGSSINGIFQARTLEWVAISYSRASSQPRDPTQVSSVSCIAGRFFTTEPPGKPKEQQRRF